MPLADVAKKAQIARSTISRWEAGKSLPRTHELEAVLAVLGVQGVERQWYFDAVPCTRFVAYHADPQTQLPLGSAHQLLRAMRIRSRHSQAEVARSLGVTAAAVSQWERGDSWPDPAHLHAIGFFLRAEPEEVVALNRGARRLGKDLHKTLESFSRHVYGMEATLLRSTANPLLDLEAIALESDALNFAGRETSPGHATELLGEVRATYAHGLMLWGRMTEARQTARKALNTTITGEPRWFQYRASVVHAQCEMSCTSRMGLVSSRSLRRMLDSLDKVDSPRNASYRTWIALTLADAEAKIGREAEAFCYVRIAQHSAETGNCVDTELPRWEAKLLNRFGRYPEALSLVDEALSKCNCPGHRAGLYLEAVRSSIGIQNLRLAEYWLHEAKSEINRTRIAVYGSRVHSLETAVDDWSVFTCNGALSLILGNQ